MLSSSRTLITNQAQAEDVGVLQPTLPPYDPVEWVNQPLAERGRMVCQAWALEGYGSPVGAYALYAIKVLFYIGMWIFFCGFTTDLGGLATIGQWWLSPLAFQKAKFCRRRNHAQLEGISLGNSESQAAHRPGIFPPIGGARYAS